MNPGHELPLPVQIQAIGDLTSRYKELDEFVRARPSERTRQLRAIASELDGATDAAERFLEAFKKISSKWPLERMREVVHFAQVMVDLGVLILRIADFAIEKHAAPVGAARRRFLTAFRRLERALEDAEDIVTALEYRAKRARGEPDDSVPWEQVKSELGL